MTGIIAAVLLDAALKKDAANQMDAALKTPEEPVATKLATKPALGVLN